MALTLRTSSALFSTATKLTHKSRVACVRPRRDGEDTDTLGYPALPKIDAPLAALSSRTPCYSHRPSREAQPVRFPDAHLNPRRAPAFGSKFRSVSPRVRSPSHRVVRCAAVYRAPTPLQNHANCGIFTRTTDENRSKSFETEKVKPTEAKF